MNLVDQKCRCGCMIKKIPHFLIYYKSEEFKKKLSLQNQQKLEKLYNELKIKYEVDQIPFVCKNQCKTKLNVKKKNLNLKKNLILKKKKCGRHVCKNYCCPSRGLRYDKDPFRNHICHETCNRKLNCGKHKCLKKFNKKIKKKLKF
jgi:hypothetical protein